MPDLQELVIHLKTKGMYRASFSQEDMQVKVVLVSEKSDTQFLDLTAGILGFRTKNVFCRSHCSEYTTRVLYKILRDWQIHSGWLLRAANDVLDWDGPELKPGSLQRCGTHDNLPEWMDADYACARK